MFFKKKEHYLETAYQVIKLAMSIVQIPKEFLYYRAYSLAQTEFISWDHDEFIHQ